MPHSDAARPNLASEVAEQAYREVRESFVGRLSGEHRRLLALNDALDGIRGGDTGPTTVFGELELFAHRLRGAAAIFDLPEVKKSANALELAASAAIGRNASCDDPAVRGAMHALELRLSLLTGGEAILKGQRIE